MSYDIKLGKYIYLSLHYCSIKQKRPYIEYKHFTAEVYKSSDT